MDMLAKKIEKILPTEKNLEKKRREFIEKGGGVAADDQSEWKNINLRLKSDMITKIDDIVQNERIGMNRTAWILEAIQEKFKRDES